MMSLGALSFVSPLVLAALLALPALWLLFRATPPPPRVERFPAFVLLKDLDPRAETPHRTPLLLLILRTLAAAAAIVALAGPVLNAPRATGGGAPILLVVDDTLASAPQWRARLSAMSRVVDEASAGGRPIYVLTTADPAKSGVIGPLAPAAARRLVDALQPQPFFADRAAAAVALDASKAKAPLDVRWLADGVSGAG
ncbi:MAG: BatA domain-containing protein, partial [Parvularculaceae bacterium]|nr:BatA domain-containing protein [Parvularculaceae bacterium]